MLTVCAGPVSETCFCPCSQAIIFLIFFLVFKEKLESPTPTLSFLTLTLTLLYKLCVWYIIILDLPITQLSCDGRMGQKRDSSRNKCSDHAKPTIKFSDNVFAFNITKSSIRKQFSSMLKSRKLPRDNNKVLGGYIMYMYSRSSNSTFLNFID